MKKANLFLIPFLIFMLFLSCSSKSFSQEQNETTIYGKVVKIVSEKENNSLQEAIGGKQIIQSVIVQITSGEMEGRKVQIENQLTSNPIYDIKVKKGDSVILTVEKSKNSYDFYISDIERFPVLLVLTGLTLVFLIILSGYKGLKLFFSILTASSLLYLAVLIIFFKDFPALLTIIPLFLAITLIFLTNIGINAKSFASILSTLAALSLEWLILYLVLKQGNITGNWDEIGVELYSRTPHLDIFNLTIFAFLITSTGIIMDMTSSIISSIGDFQKTNPQPTFKEQCKEGLNIIGNKLGARINTLSFFFLGLNLPLLLLIYNGPFSKIINFQSIFIIIGTYLSILISLLAAALISCIFGNLIMRKTSHKH